jgi:hypothetical protein
MVNSLAFERPKSSFEVQVSDVRGGPKAEEASGKSNQPTKSTSPDQIQSTKPDPSYFLKIQIHYESCFGVRCSDGRYQLPVDF